MNLIFVRHGQSIWNLENKFTGWVDVELSERGVKEAEEAGRTLLSYKFTPEICATSFLQRSKSTAEIILNKMKEEIELNIETKEIWQLNERHYGALQGLDIQKFEEKPLEKKFLKLVPPNLYRDTL